MSYRNDHDAALARVDALEAELHHMALEYEKLRTATPAPAAPRRRVWAAIAITAGALSAFAIPIGAHLAASNAPPAPSIAPTPAAPFDLGACVRAIHMPPQLDATRTDPHGAAQPVEPIVASIAPCRMQLAPGAWRDAEDQLAGAVSRIVVYYEHDPYALDGYRTARQLWREYDDALAHRYAVLPVQ